MKRFIFCVMMIISFGVMANERNLYIKGSGDIFSKYNNLQFEFENIPIEGYLKIGDEKSKTIDILTAEKAKGFGGFVEVTKNVSPEFELGVGVGYISRPTTEVKYEFKPEEISEEEVSNRLAYTPLGNMEITVLSPGYKSLPLYFATKYNIKNDSEIIPYIKAELGYSFNYANKGYDIKVKSKNERNLEDETMEPPVMDVPVVPVFSFDVTNGLYAGIGIGLEYHNFFGELLYNYTGATAKIYDTSELNVINKTGDYSNKAVRVSLGYKFNF